jgi:2-dehydro-3-deoxyphosphogluconate aldolase/(4S)-4-hydroxy-2-oxoglutarate aldolase
MSEALEAIKRTRVIAVVRLARYDQATEVARALLEGGVIAIELTHTGSGVDAAVSALRAALGDQLQVGVGTVLAANVANASIDAGAQFVVTPVVRPSVVSACRSRAVPVICGALTPTEILDAHDAGADMIKIFPARAVTPEYLRDILAPLPMLQLVPTGGVGPENARAYLRAGAVAVGIGGNLVARDAVARGDWRQITLAAQSCIAATQEDQPIS